MKNEAIRDANKFCSSVERNTVLQDLTEQDIRELVKSEIPKFIKGKTQTILIEELEVSFGRARIDLAVIGDRFIGIELKGPKDSVKRLPNQINAYSQCFDQVILVVHELHEFKAKSLIPDWWGLVVSHDHNGELTYIFRKRPKKNPNLDLDALLSLLWRQEIEQFSCELLGKKPKSRATKKTIRTELISSIDPSILRRQCINTLRGRSEWRGTFIHK